MSTEEQDAINRLLDSSASAAKQRTALKWFAEYLEEGYILNLPPTKGFCRHWRPFHSARRWMPLQTRARNLIKKYHRQR